MSYEVRLVDLQEQPAAAVHGHVAHDGIADFLGSVFGEVVGTAEQQGVGVAGAPFARYRPADDGGWDIEAGFPVTGAVSASGRVEPVTLPGGRVARTMHVGAYEKLGDAYKATSDWITDNGYVATGEPWELYLDGPEVPEPRTEVFFPCAESHHS